ncbi:hypothetical protein PQO03_19545 [Lentisphaera profundi]|uniref:Uncharacterized protein n=1 Tax=Lentisphaera profundi TaxID=1658616 RepID=A0ABY7VXL3_9BACT|nr:hypothetical protein [Lentisphaera profundi]WDE98018.1 hypothetical protein PQO03_19545 [Lentisphaera profundi]
MRILKFSKEDLILSVEDANSRLADMAKLANPMQAYGLHENAYEVWVFFEPAERSEKSFFQQISIDDEAVLEQDIKAYWQGSHLMIATVTLDQYVTLALFRKLYV